MKKILSVSALFILGLCQLAFATGPTSNGVQQSGSVTATHCAIWVGKDSLGDSGTSCTPAQVYPTSGIAVSTGSAWGTSLQIGTSGAVLGLLNGNNVFTGNVTFSNPVAASVTGNAATVTTNANLSGDISSVGNVTTLATVNSNTGSFGSASAVPVLTLDGKGRVTSATTTATVGSFNGRSGAVSPTSGDYTVSQVTGAAPVASPTFTGTVTIPSGASISGFAPLASPTFTGSVNGGSAIWSSVDTALNFVATGTGANTLPVGTTGQRPSTAEGLLRDNTTINALETYINGGWQQIVSSANGLVNMATQITGVAPVANGGTGSSYRSSMAKLRAAAAVAQAKNRFITTPVANATITSSTSDPGTSGMTVLVSNGIWGTTTCNTTSGSKVLTSCASMAYVVGNSLNAGTVDPASPQIVLEHPSSGGLYPNNIPLGSYITAYNTGSNSITINKTATGTATGITVDFLRPIFSIDGTLPYDYSGNLLTGGTTVNSSTPTVGGGAKTIYFMTDAANFSTSAATIYFTAYANGANNVNGIKVLVDDVYISASPTFVSQANSTFYYTLTLTTPGVHKVAIEQPVQPSIGKIALVTGAKMWQPNDSQKPTLCTFSDSFFNAGANGDWANANVARRIAAGLGARLMDFSVSGTGYIANGSTNYAWSSTQRTRDVLASPYGCDALVMFGSVNDAGQTSSAEQTAATTTWTALRANLPNTPFFLFGVPTTNNASSASVTTLETGLQAAYTAWGDNNSWYWNVTNDSQGSWWNTSNLAISGGGGYVDSSSFTGSITTTTLTVTGITNGVIQIGDVINGGTITYGNSCSNGTCIVAYGTGTGGTGTYIVNTSQTVASAALTGGDGTHPNDAYGQDVLARTALQKIYGVLNSYAGY